MSDSSFGVGGVLGSGAGDAVGRNAGGTVAEGEGTGVAVGMRIGVGILVGREARAGGTVGVETCGVAVSTVVGCG